jgi:hypothetical protein
MLIDPLLEGLLEDKRKFDPHIFQYNPKRSFNGLFFQGSLGDALMLSVEISVYHTFQEEITYIF